MIQLEEFVEEVTTDDYDSLGHYYCVDCYPDGEKAYCGKNIASDSEELEEGSVDCVVCLDIKFCPVCDSDVNSL